MSLTAFWIPASLLAGIFQALRSSIQVGLRQSLTINGAGLIRYVYALPFAMAMATTWFLTTGTPLPRPDMAFWGYAALGGLAQIFGTQMLIAASHRRGFVFGTALSKLEALIAAIASAILLHERLPALAWLGIVVGVTGILMMALSLRDKASGPLTLALLSEPAARLGVGAATAFALTAVLVKAATVACGIADPLGAALYTLTVVLALQAVMQGSWIARREPATLIAVVGAWRKSSVVGFLSAVGSACWFTGFALAPVALVRLLGQIELVFTVVLSHLMLGERPLRAEVIGLFLIAGGSLLALLATTL